MTDDPLAALQLALEVAQLKPARAILCEPHETAPVPPESPQEPPRGR